VSRKALNFPQEIKLDPTATVLSITTPRQAKKTLQIILDTTKVVPVSGDRFRQQKIKLEITNKIEVGGLTGKITTSYKKYWVEIINKAGEVVLVLDTPKALKLDRLTPDTYRIRVKIDEDNNGTWRAGNADLTTVPEKIYHHPATIEVRANWEIEENLTF
jgi:hypothetical protein